MRRLIENTFFVLLAQTIISIQASSPILEMDVLKMKQENDKIVIVKYVDMPFDITASVTLQCKLGLATSYDWRIVAKQGAPYAASIVVGDTNKIENEWERTIAHGEYPWDLLVIECIPKLLLETLITFVWVVLKMKSNTDVPYHPVICEYPQAKCHADKFNCYKGFGEAYYGNWNRAKNGEACEQWNVCWPRKRTNADGFDGKGNHNYCRNWRDMWKHHKMYKPFCFTDSSNLIPKVCGVPECTECMYGDGKTHFPDKKWYFSQYGYSKTILTVESVFFNKKGKKQHVRCHDPGTEHWHRNYCRKRAEVGLHYSNQPEWATCLAIPDPKDEDKRSPHYYNVWWDRLKWLRCVIPQCTVRQVWFLIVNTNGKLEFDLADDKHLEVPIYIGRGAIIKFYHFGTSLCAGMTLEAAIEVRLFLPYLELECKPTPQMSQIKIKQPRNELQGDYTLKYIFREGKPTIDSVEYKMNFRLIIKSPTTISLTPAVICPGYPTQTTAKIHGSLKIKAREIRWYHSMNKKKWSDIDNTDKRFSLSRDGSILQITKVRDAIYIKIIALKGTDEFVEAIQKIDVHALPMLTANKTLIDAYDGSKVELKIECNLDAETNWLFGGTTIDKESVDSDYTYLSYVSEIGSIKIEILIIKKFKKALQGIYTVEVLHDGCRNEQLFHVGIKAKDTF